MQLFEKLIDHPEAVRLVLENTHRLAAEDVPLVEARGLALAQDLKARFDSPPFDNSAVDGYALRSADADAVVMVENTSGWGEEFELKKAASPGQNVRGSGEDVREGEVILRAGTEVGPPEIALAATQGYGVLPVYRRPEVVVLSTGTELVEPGERDLEPGEIYDSNSFAVMAQSQEIGARARRVSAASDDAAAIRNAVNEALETADVVVTSC